MKRSNLLISLLILSAVIGLLHYLALEFYLYWTLWWFDMVLHFLGGLLAGAACVWFFSVWRAPTYAYILPVTLFVPFLGALIIGVAWEYFEIFTGLYQADNYVLDTSIDLLMDALGGLAAYGIVQWRGD